MKAKRVVILQSQSGDWEGLYVDGYLQDEGHTLGEGDSKLYMLKAAEEYSFKSSDVKISQLSDDDDLELGKHGNMLSYLGDYKTMYDA